jgi:hypothetical protein
VVGARAGKEAHGHGDKTKRQISRPNGSCHRSVLCETSAVADCISASPVGPAIIGG